MSEQSREWCDPVNGMWCCNELTAHYCDEDGCDHCSCGPLGSMACDAANVEISEGRVWRAGKPLINCSWCGAWIASGITPEVIEAEAQVSIVSALDLARVALDAALFRIESLKGTIVRLRSELKFKVKKGDELHGT